MTIHAAYIAALLADASYVERLTSQDLQADLTPRMTPDLAEYIADNFRVAARAEGYASGFEATVWEENATGRLHVSIRGTQGLRDIAEDALLASTGVAYDQLADMVNWWLRLTGTGEVPQVTVRTTVVGAGVPPLLLREMVSAPSVQATGELSNVIGIASVNGHSLGGYLASSFARLFGARWPAESIDTFNSAGFNRLAVPNIEEVFGQIAQLIGPELGLLAFSEQQNNYFAENGMNLTTNTWNPIGFKQYGTRIPLFQEDSTTLALINNHYMYKITDLLALGDALERLDPSFSTSMLSELVRVGSDDMRGSYESVLDPLRQLLIGPRIQPTPTSDASGDPVQPVERVTYHANLAELRSHPTYATAAHDGVRFALLPTGAAELADMAAASDGLPYRYAVMELQPFVVLGPEWLYAPQTESGELQLFDSLTGEGRISTQYLHNRSDMLTWLVQRNATDAVIVREPGGESRDYLSVTWAERDGLDDIRILEKVQVGGVASRRGLMQVAFGSLRGDSLMGFGKGDRLYGDQGADTLVGQGGDDYIEGGFDSDLLSGSFGNDTLNGGAADDVLNGGVGRDRYQFQRNGGQDRILDARENGVQVGEVWFDGEHVAGLGEQSIANRDIYNLTGSLGGSYVLTYTGGAGTGGLLNIFRSGDSSIVTVLDFQSGDFGIELTTLPPVAMTDLPGTADSDNSFSTQAGHAESLRSEVENQRVFGFAGNDRIVVSHQGAEAYGGVGRDYLTNGVDDQKLYGEEGDDVLIASAGNDVLDGGTGNDALQGGTDDDVLIGGEGNDFIDGGLGSDAIDAGDGHDFIVGGGTMVVAMDEGALDLPEPPQFGVLLFGDAVGFGGMTGVLLAAGDGANVIDAGAGNDVVIGGDATDYVEGGLGNDVLLGFAGLDSVFGDEGDDYLLGDVSEGAYTLNGQLLFTLAEAHGSDYLDGGAGNDTLGGDGGGDELAGGEGNDLLLGDDARLAAQWHGADYLDGGEGDDQLIGHGADDVLLGGAGHDRLDGDSSDTPFADHGADYLDGEDGDDLLKGSGGADTLFGGDGADQLFGDTDDTPLANQGDDFLDGGAGEDYLRGYAGADVLYGGDDADEMLGDAGDDVLDGEGGDDLISGGDGADELAGGAGDDDLQADAGDDTLDGGEGADLLFGGAGNDAAQGGAGNDQLAGNEGDDTLHGGDGDDRAFGEAGTDAVDGGAGADTLLGGAANDTLLGGEGDDLLAGEDATLGDFGADDRLEGGAGADTLLGEGGADFLAGGTGADLVVGGAGDDSLEGNAGDDLLHGGGGNDVLAGGEGNDAYFVDGFANGVDRIVDSTANGDLNTLVVPFEYGLGVVRLSLGSLVVKVGTGIEVHIEGFDPDDPWADVAINRFEFTNRTLTYEELLAENPIFITGTPGEDTLRGTVLDDVIAGLGSADVLLGREGDDQMTGGEGADTLAGGAGDDTYRDVDAGDAVLEQAGEGLDKVETELRVYTLPDHVEDLVVLGIGGTADLTGNDLDNTITVNSAIDGGIVVRGLGGNDQIVGSAGNDTLDGGEGSNHLAGRGGDDVYLVTGADQTYILELAGEGHDTILAHTSVGMPLDSEIEDVVLVEGSGAISAVANGLRNHIVGNGLGNILYGELPGNAVDGTVPSSPLPPGTVYQILGSINDAEGDILEGRGGDDFLDGGGHSDTLLGGEGSDALVGQVGADLLVGGAGDDTLDGSRVLTVHEGVGIVAVGDDESTDTMEGGVGDDTYFFDDADDILVEAVGEGTDTVITSSDHVLQGNFENLVLTGTEARVGGGNADANVLRDETQLDPFSGAVSTLLGAAGADTLVGAGYMDGGEGADVMIARLGWSTTFIVDDAGDLVVKAVLDGQFAYVESSVTFTLSANIDNLTLTGTSAVDGFGNDRSNVIVGNEASNRLVDAHDFAETVFFRDLLYGMGGDDLLVTGAGRHYLDGGEGNDMLDAGAGHDHLDGGEGADTMLGGAGDDVFYVDDAADVTEERADDGYDTVYAGLSHVLGGNLEALYLTGEADLRGEGNDLDNLIVGNWGANRLVGRGGDDRLLADDGDDLVQAGDGDDFLDGGSGTDTLQGGAGSDTYVVSTRDDVVAELAGAGVDTVIASDDFELAAHVENLVFIGDFGASGPDIAGLDGAGNDLANAIQGNDGDNSLEGRGGDDSIDGRAGDDDIEGDEGADTLYGGDDALRFTERDDEEGGGDGDDGGGQQETLPDKAPREGNDALLAWNADTLRGGDGSDSLDGGSGDDQLYGDADDDVLYGGDDGLTADEVFRDEDEEGGGSGEVGEDDGRIFLTNDDYLEGGEGNDVLDGGSGDDELRGGEGDDHLFGGTDGPLNTGNDDFLDGGEGRDTLAGGSGDDLYVLQDGTFVETADIPVYSDCGTVVPGAVTRVWTHDAVIEAAGEGFDTVIVLGDYALPEHVEQLLLEEHADARIGRGNGSDNRLAGNSFDNRLEGLEGRDELDGNAGDDVLHGGAGDDVLRGGAGGDVFLFGRGGGRDLVSEHDSGDAVHLIDGLTLADVTLSTNGSDVTIGVNGSRDRIVLAGWLEASDRVGSIVFCDGPGLDEAAIAGLAAGLVLQAADDALEARDGGPAATGNLLANDVSSNAAALLTIGDPGSYEGDYGTLVIAEDGSFSYLAGPQVAWLAEGESISERFDYVAQDEANANDRASLEVTILGRNDAPTMGDASGGTATEDARVSVEGEELLFNGAFEVEELYGWAIAGDTDYVGETRASHEGTAAYFGAVGAETVLGQEVGTTAGATYLVSFRLRGGAEAGATFSASWNGVEVVSLADETLDEYTEFRFLAQGAADAGATSLSFALRNDPDFWYLDTVSVRQVDLVLPELQHASGSIAFGDADGNDAHHVSFAPQAEGYLGRFEAAIGFDSGWDEPGAVRWSFEAENGALQFLRAGETIVQSYDVTVFDAFGASATSTVSVLLAGANDGPTAHDDAVTLVEGAGQEATGDVLANDTDPDHGTILRVIYPGVVVGSYGTLTLNGDGTYRYVLDADAASHLANGEVVTEVFTYTVTDDAVADAQQATAHLEVRIEGRNAAPITAGDSGAVQEDGVLEAAGNVLANDSDPEGAALTVVSTGVFEGAFGTLTLNADGTYLYALDNASAAVQRLRAGDLATDAFAYAADDGTAQAPGTLVITVAGANDAPIVSAPIADRALSTGAAFSFTLPSDTFTDADAGDALTYSASTADGSPLPAWLSFNAATRTFSGTPSQAGAVQLQVTATDSAGAAASENFSLTISGTTEETGELLVGTDGNDVLVGTAFDDVIDGREGFDKMSGGKGDDAYFVDEWCDKVDKVIERANEGRDAVFALTDYSLAANVEDVQLLGCEDLDATGNTQANVLAGNEGDNVLSGRGGSDAYVYRAGDGRDVIDDKGAAGEVDVLRLQGINAANVRLKRSSDDLVVDFPGSEGRVTLKKWFSSSANRVEAIQFDDGSVWDEGKIRSRLGMPATPQTGGGSCGHGHDGHHGNDRDHGGHHRHGDGDDRRHDRDDGRRTDGVDEALGHRLKQPVRFDFEEVTRALGTGVNGGRTMTAAEIAQQWARVQRYTDCLGDCRDDDAHDADIAQLRNLFGAQPPQHGDCFGFDGSTGGSQGPGKWFKALEGLCEGFRRL